MKKKKTFHLADDVTNVVTLVKIEREREKEREKKER